MWQTCNILVLSHESCQMQNKRKDVPKPRYGFNTLHCLIAECAGSMMRISLSVEEVVMALAMASIHQGTYVGAQLYGFGACWIN